MEKREINRFLIISLGIACLFELFLITGAIDIINDKTAYINGLLSDRAMCNGKLDSLKHDYRKMEDELKEYQEKYGELVGLKGDDTND